MQPLGQHRVGVQPGRSIVVDARFVESALQRAESDLHPGDPVDDMRTAEYGRESAAARAETSDDTPAPRETPSADPSP